MTAITTTDRPRSRRALLAGALGGLGAWAAAAAARVDPAAAAAGDPIRMGRLNRASGTSTELQTSTSKPAFRATQLGAGTALRGDAGSGRAVMGVAGSEGTGVWASSPNHYAVSADSPDGIAVFATSNNGHAVRALTNNDWAVVAESTNSFGLVASGTVGLAASGSIAAAQFTGRISLNGVQDMSETLAPTAPPTNTARFFARDNGSGKTQLCVQFPTGAVQVIATEP